MALIQCNFKSQTLQLATSMNVILPEEEQENDSSTDPGKIEYPVLYLLHGLSDDHTAWCRKTSIERYAQKYNLAVIMPAVDRSFYSDMVAGNNYWTYISKEVPLVSRKYFPVSNNREKCFVAGLSMGGYGAFKLTLRQPEKFAAAASLSGVLDIVSAYRENEEVDEDKVREFELIFGDINKLQDSDNDLIYLLKKNVKNNIKLPDLYQCCGTDDFLYRNNQYFKKLAERLNVNLTYEEDPAEHEWSYWDKKIQRFLELLKKKNFLG